MKKLLSTFMIFALAFVLVSCGGKKDDPKEDTKYAVTFDLNGGTGTAPASQSVKAGEKVTKPSTDPTKNNATFKHWSKTRTGSAYNFDDAVNGNFTLYAVWQDNNAPVDEKVVVTFNANGGSLGTVPASVEVVKGATVSNPGTPTAPSGQVFKFWATSANGTTAYAWSTPVNAALTLYAVYGEAATPGTAQEHNFTTNGLTSSFFTFTSVSLYTGSEPEFTGTTRLTFTHEGTTYTKAAKVNSSAQIGFTTSNANAVLTVIGLPRKDLSSKPKGIGVQLMDSTGTLVEGKSFPVQDGGVITFTIANPGTYYITRYQDESGVFALKLAE